MSENSGYMRTEKSLSAAWSRAFLNLIGSSVHELSPFFVSIAADADGNAVEDADLRHALDASLEDSGYQTVEKVAKSIFPEAMWRRAKGDRHKLYASYLASLPDFVSMQPRMNHSGLYFARLVGYGVRAKDGQQEAHLPAEKLKEGGNQLEFIIKTCKPGAQRMALQAAIFDPMRDQSAARRVFPCLQHITFAPDFHRRTLALNAFYATQQLFIRAYGNWLGLFRLGGFVASQTNLRFERLNCFTGVEKMEVATRPKRGDLADRLTDLARACVENSDGTTALAGTEAVCNASG
jgi:hypothetical protein